MFTHWKNSTVLSLTSAIAVSSISGFAPSLTQPGYAQQSEVEVEVELIEPGLESVAPAEPAPTVEVELIEPGLEGIAPVEPVTEVEVILEDDKVNPTGFFSCNETPTPLTAFYSPEGSLPVIYWVSEYFTHSGWDPLTRCRSVTGRFQRYYEEGTLDYITTGIVNRLPVVCVSSELGGPCTGVLLTLKPGENASLVIQRLFDLSYGRNVGPLYESGSRLYLDFNQYLEQLQASYQPE